VFLALPVLARVVQMSNLAMLLMVVILANVWLLVLTITMLQVRTLHAYHAAHQIVTTTCVSSTLAYD